MKNARGVVLLHTLILLMVMAWLSILLLQWTLTRAINAKAALTSNGDRALLAAAQAQISTCLSSQANLNANISSCANISSLAPSCGTQIVGHAGQPYYRYEFAVCSSPTTPPCKIQIKLCPTQTPCGAPACPTPALWL